MTNYCISRERYELLLQTAYHWAVINGEECPLCDGHGMPKVVNSNLEVIQVASGTLIYTKQGQADKVDIVLGNARRVLNFTQRQLEFLIVVSEGEDWHPAALIDVVTNAHKDGTFAKHALTDFEFQGMIRELKRFSIEKMVDFQAAVNLLGSL